MQIINSKKNEVIKRDYKLLKKKYREKQNEFLIFGKTLVEIAINLGKVKWVYTSDLTYFNNTIKVNYLSKDVLSHLAEGANVDICAVCEKIDYKIDYSKPSIILQNVQDPGNVGTIIRSAKAFGYEQIIMSDDSVDIYNTKLQRAMQGSQFEVNIIQMNLEKFLLKSENTLITTFLNEENKKELIDIKKENKNFNIMFGNEGNGISEEFKKFERINYKLELNFESLNVAVAAGIIMYEFKRENNE